VDESVEERSSFFCAVSTFLEDASMEERSSFFCALSMFVLDASVEERSSFFCAVLTFLVDASVEFFEDLNLVGYGPGLVGDRARIVAGIAEGGGRR
jgi:hypothetical protein